MRRAPLLGSALASLVVTGCPSRASSTMATNDATAPSDGGPMVGDIAPTTSDGPAAMPGRVGLGEDTDGPPVDGPRRETIAGRSVLVATIPTRSFADGKTLVLRVSIERDGGLARAADIPVRGQHMLVPTQGAGDPVRTFEAAPTFGADLTVVETSTWRWAQGESKASRSRTTKLVRHYVWRGDALVPIADVTDPPPPGF